MIAKKYNSDYKLEYFTDEKDKVHTKAVYVGQYFVFTEEGRPLKRSKLYFSLLLFCAWAAFFGSLLLRASLTRLAYSVLPLACCVLTLIYLSSSVFAMLGARPPLIREQRDKICDRLGNASILTLCFSGVSLVGSIVGALIRRDTLALPDDIFYILLIAVIAAASAAIFAKRKRARMTALKKGQENINNK